MQACNQWFKPGVRVKYSNESVNMQPGYAGIGSRKKRIL